MKTPMEQILDLFVGLVAERLAEGTRRIVFTEDDIHRIIDEQVMKTVQLAIEEADLRQVVKDEVEDAMKERRESIDADDIDDLDDAVKDVIKNRLRVEVIVD
jgi:hypothetical protein